MDGENPHFIFEETEAQAVYLKAVRVHVSVIMDLLFRDWETK